MVLTLFVNCVSIIKLCTCFSARVSSSFLETTATNRAVHPAPWTLRKSDSFNRHRDRCRTVGDIFILIRDYTHYAELEAVNFCSFREAHRETQHRDRAPQTNANRLNLHYLSRLTISSENTTSVTLENTTAIRPFRIRRPEINS